MKKLTKLAAFLMALIILLIGAAFIIKQLNHKMLTIAYPQKYSQYVDKYSEQYNVNKFLVYAVMHTESGFNKNAESNQQARGLMQIIEETFEWAKTSQNDKRNVTFDDMYDPETNIQYGTFILSLLLKEFQSQNTAVAAYHSGWGSVKRWLSDPEISSNGIDLDIIPSNVTDQYVKKVNKAFKMYESLYNN